MAPAPVFLEHPSSLAHDTGSHPEQAARIPAIGNALAQRDWLGFKRVRSPEVERETLYAVHPERYVEAIDELSARGGGHLDPDTLLSEGSFEAALHSAGGAVALVDALISGEAPTGFSAHRPPGHHAEAARGMGFCLFNNVAVAARHALDARGLERVMILDWDVHHGNGTNDIFHAAKQVLFVSIHQSPLYPGTGPAGDAGSGPGTGFTVNLPVPPGSGDEVFCSLVEHVVAPLAREWVPQLVLVSAGYDAHREDPLGDCTVSDEGYVTMTRSVCRFAGQLGAPVGAVLEGGYALDALGRSVAATMAVLAAGPDAVGAGDPAELEVAPESRAALARLATWWPGLG
ncbi:MAG TPA: histone deacetylase [Solirubrobacteraceae bacterium]|jgi:acetoin utilization deacetylase AcuC-like enzyme